MSLVESTMVTVRKVALSLPGSISRIDRALRGRMGRTIFGLALLVWLLLSFVSVQSSPVHAEGFGPFPVRNFQPIQQLVLSMPGDRAAVLRKGVLDVRVELAETASIFRDGGPQTSVTMKFETLRSGVF